MHISDLKTDPNNANRGTERGQQALTDSIGRYGLGRSILIDKNGVVIAGNKTLETAGQLGIDNVDVIKTDGTKLIAVQRTDLDIEDETARQMAYADNRVGQLSLEWDEDQIAKDLASVDLISLWTETEIERLLAVNFAGDPDEEIDADDSGVRMVQLFFDGESHMKFLEVVAILKERYGSETLTDTVLHGLTDAADNS
jgi:hypothetical protein